MLSINRLGNLGRLANQMFQYASLKGIASNRGYLFLYHLKMHLEHKMNWYHNQMLPYMMSLKI